MNKRRFCIHGHDTSVCGRSRWNYLCNACDKIKKHKYHLRNKERLNTYCRKWFKNNPYWHKEYYRNKLRMQIWSIKCNPCTDCKQRYEPWQMEFDHLPTFNKLFQINAVYHLTPKVFTEIAKCQLVCANCHNQRTFWRNYVRGTHPRSVQSIWA